MRRIALTLAILGLLLASFFWMSRRDDAGRNEKPDGAPKTSTQDLAEPASVTAPEFLPIGDANSGAELDHARLMRMDDYLNEGVVIPAEAGGVTPFLENQQSPIALEPSAVENNGQAITLFAYSRGNAWNSMRIDRTGGGDQYLKLAPGGDLTVVLREGERPVDCPTSMLDLKLRDSRGASHPPRTALGSGKLTCFLKEAENYTLSLPALPGFMPIPDQQVDLTSQESVDLVIQLVRQQ